MSYSHLPHSFGKNCLTLSEGGMTLRQFLRQHFPNTSGRALQKKVDQGLVKINNRPVNLGHTLLINGDRIEIKGGLSPQPLDRDLDWSKRSIWMNENFCVVDKPAGVASEKVAQMVGQSSWILVHRLDKETSGVLLLAKSPSMARQAQEIFQKRRVAKYYLALVSKKAPQKLTVRARLRPKLKLRGKSLWEVCPPNQMLSQKKSHRAVTHFNSLSHQADVSLLLCRPITGKTHQIRLHAAHMGHAILGDRDYGLGNQPFCTRVMLHAQRLVIPELDLDATSDLPQDIVDAAKQLNLLIDSHKLRCLEDCCGALSDQ